MYRSFLVARKIHAHASERLVECTSRELRFDMKIVDFTQSIEKLQVCKSGSFFLSPYGSEDGIVSLGRNSA